MKRPCIAIIDSGVKKNHRNFKNDELLGFSFNKEKISEDFEDTFGHGTAVYNIIRNSKDIADIINIKINGIERGIDEEILISILEYINENLDVNIINLSSGLTICQKGNELYNICRILDNKDVIIVSAFDNDGAMSFPAAFDNVIGVNSGIGCNRITDFEYIEDTVLNINAKGNLQKLAWSDPEFLILGGNSFACAHVTNKVAELYNKGFCTRHKVLNEFKKISKKIYTPKVDPVRKELFDIKKCVLFPFNKEMHSLVRYEHMLNFEIVDIYDMKYTARIGATTNQLLKDNLIKNHVIKNIDNIDWDSFDTIVIGHLEELSSLVNIGDLKSFIIKKSIEKKKKIYSFDDINEYVDQVENNIFFPKVDEKDLPGMRFGKLYRASKPVFGVFGTSSKQGKFTLQMKLRELFEKNGYKVGQIGTEPHSLLFNMDYVFPMGYNSTVHIKEYDVIRYLNFIINNLCLKDKDIILVGSQSGTLTYDISNIIQYNLSQYGFLMGTCPDAICLVINPFDDICYIERTINFIKSSAESDIIALVVFPMDLKDGWSGIYGEKIPLSQDKFLQLKKKYEQYFRIPVYKLGENFDMQQLFNNIIDYF